MQITHDAHCEHSAALLQYFMLTDHGSSLIIFQLFAIIIIFITFVIIRVSAHAVFICCHCGITAGASIGSIGSRKATIDCKTFCQKRHSPLNVSMLKDKAGGFLIFHLSSTNLICKPKPTCFFLPLFDLLSGALIAIRMNASLVQPVHSKRFLQHPQMSL